MATMLILEKKKSGSEFIYRIEEPYSHLDAQKNLRSETNVRNSLISWFKDVFLPQGYPHTVSPDYIQYQIWDSIQAYCSNLAGALSLHATLVGIGVGEENASPIAAAVSWLTKDGTGMISSIYFAYMKGSELDNNSKQWRLFADVANDAAHFVKLLSPYLPIPFGVTFCLSSIISSLVGVAGGATRASLIQHQALCNNMADVSAKDGSQETLVNLAGLLTSLTLLPYLTSNQWIVWITFTLCVVLHLFSNYKAMRSLNMKTLNRGRLLHILNSWTTKEIIPNIHSTNSNEPMFLGSAFKSYYLTDGFNFKMGISINEILNNCSVGDCNTLSFEDFGNMQYNKFKLCVPGEKKKIIYAVFAEDATNVDILKSFWTAYLLALNLQQTATSHTLPKFIVTRYRPHMIGHVYSIQELAIKQFPYFLQALQDNGWQLDPLRLNIGEWRCTVQDEDKKEL